jgi:hypothetical protein
MSSAEAMQQSIFYESRVQLLIQEREIELC